MMMAYFVVEVSEVIEPIFSRSPCLMHAEALNRRSGNQSARQGGFIPFMSDAPILDFKTVTATAEILTLVVALLARLWHS